MLRWTPTKGLHLWRTNTRQRRRLMLATRCRCERKSVNNAHYVTIYVLCLYENRWIATLGENTYEYACTSRMWLGYRFLVLFLPLNFIKLLNHITEFKLCIHHHTADVEKLMQISDMLAFFSKESCYCIKISAEAITTPSKRIFS